MFNIMYQKTVKYSEWLIFFYQTFELSTEMYFNLHECISSYTNMKILQYYKQKRTNQERVFYKFELLI